MAVSHSLLLDFFNLTTQALVAPYQRSQIDDVDDPGRGVGGVEEIHLELRGSSRASSAWVSSTSRCRISRRYRDQQTCAAKQRNASQLISNTRSMRGSIEPPPPITGCGC